MLFVIGSGNMNKPFYFILVLIVLFLNGFSPARFQNNNLILQDEHVALTPHEFYINDIIDERENKSAVVWLTGNYSPEKYHDFEGGGFAAIKRFVDHNLPKNRALRPIVIGLKKFRADEARFTDGHIAGNVSVVMSFNLLDANGDTLHLLDYNGKAKYERNAGPLQDIEPTLRHLLVNGLIYLNTWMNKQAPTNINLAKTVRVNFTDYSEKTEGDTIYYSFNRPLTWADFQGKVPQSRFDAEVFATIGYSEETTVINGVINLKLDIKVCLPKNDCWVKEGSQNDYALNHEQRHFDIAKIVAEHFKQRIKAENLPVANYDGPVNVDYLDAYREMDSLQLQYDNETNHGANHTSQERWNERIDQELKTFGH